MVLGYDLPVLAAGVVEARSYRTWQFVDPLLVDGHQVCLVVSSKDNEFDIAHSLAPNLHYHRLAIRRPGWPRHLRHLYEQFDPEGVLAVMFNNCLRVTRLPTDRPIWMDLYGDKLAETQVAEYTQHSSRGRRNMSRYLKTILRYGDVYSTCSTPQKYALVGQLGAVSRLDRHTFGYEFVYPVLPGARTHQGDDLVPSLRGDLIPTDAFVVLWCGGYNVWTDVDTLFQALDAAMSCDPRIVFVSVGGGVKLKQNDCYERFLAMIETSAHRQRYHMLGWRPVSEVPMYYRAADVGINLDAFHYETLLGTRTRLVEMMSYGLPVITSLGCELSVMIRDRRLGLTFPIGDVTAFRDQILMLARDSTQQEMLAQRAEHYATHQLSFAETTHPFREWANRPYHAPDREKGARRWDLREIEYYLRFLVRGLLWRLWALERGD